MLKRQFHKVSLEGLDSCTLLSNSLFFVNMVERVTGQKTVNCIWRVWSYVTMISAHLHECSHRQTNRDVHSHTDKKGKHEETIWYSGMCGRKNAYTRHHVVKRKKNTNRADWIATHDGDKPDTDYIEQDGCNTCPMQFIHRSTGEGEEEESGSLS